MGQITLNDLLQFDKEDFNNIKIKLNQSNGIDDPMELYQRDQEIVNTQWLLWKGKRRYFYEGQIAICFLKLTWDTWLLTTIKKITKDLDVKDGVSYEAYELEEYRKV